MKTGIIIIDPGHGVMKNEASSNANHAVSALGNLKNNLTLHVSLSLGLRPKELQGLSDPEINTHLSTKDRSLSPCKTNALII